MQYIEFCIEFKFIYYTCIGTAIHTWHTTEELESGGMKQCDETIYKITTY